MVWVIILVEGDGQLGPTEPRQCGKGVNCVHLMLGDVTLLAGFIYLRTLEDHEASLGLRKLNIFLLDIIHWLASLHDRLLGLTLLAKGAIDIDSNGGTSLKEVIHLPTMDQTEGFECQECLRPGGTVGHGTIFSRLCF